MYLFLNHPLKKLCIIILTLLYPCSLQAAEYSVIDPENIITDEQQKLIEKIQADISTNHNSLVTYAFYSINASKLGIRMEWESKLAKAKEEGLTSDKFHLLICVGKFSQQNTVDIFYKNQPPLEDVNDLDTCIASLKQSLTTEPNIKDLIEYRSQEFIQYLLNLIKITLIITAPIVAFLLIWYMLASINNKKSYKFPTTTHTKTKKRLGAPYGATSISQSSR